MWRNFVRFRNTNRVSQEKAPAIAGIADAFWDTSAPSQPSGVESILQKKSDIEPHGTQFCD